MSTGPTGRAAELEHVEAFLRTATVRAAGLTLVGDAGIGKSTIWRSAVDGAAGRCTVLRANPAQGEAPLAYAVLADLLSGVPTRHLPDLPDPQRDALDVALLRRSGVRHRGDRRAVGAALRSVFAGLATRRPLLVAIDDAQWIDTETARVLDFALRRLDDSRTGLLVTCRTGDGTLRAAVSAMLAALPADRVRTVRVGPLAAADIDRIVGDRVVGQLTSSQRRRIRVTAAGNPFLAVELAQSLAAGVVTSDSQLPPSLLELAAGRMSTLSAATRELLLVAAVAGAPTVVELALAVRRGSSEVMVDLEPACAADVIRIEAGTVHFTHPLHAAARIATAGATQLRTAHRAIAHSGGSAEARAHHLAAAHVEPDPGLAADLDAAAVAARRRGALDAAASLITHAIRLTPPGDRADRDRRRVRLAEVIFRGGEFDAPRQLLESVLTEPLDADLERDALQLLAELRYHQDSFAEAAALFARLLTVAGNDRQVRAHAHLHLAYSAIATGDFSIASAQAARARDCAGSLPAAQAAPVLAVAVMANFLNGRGVDEDDLDRALDLEDDAEPIAVEMRPTVIAGSLRLYAGRATQACTLLARARERAETYGNDGDLAFVWSCLSWAEMWRGELGAARAAAAESMLAAGRTGSLTAEAVALANGSVVAAHRGDLGSARSAANRALELSARTGFLALQLWSRWALVAAGLQDGRYAAAVEAAEPILRSVETDGLGNPVCAVLLADAIEAMVACGQVERAAPLIAELAAVAARSDWRWAMVAAGRCRALHCAATGQPERAAAAIDMALRGCDGLEQRHEHGRAALVAGQLARRRRHRRVARQHLETARRIFDASGAAGWSARAAAELERVAPPSRPTAVLSASEQLVAELAAAGLTNRAVAARLQISPKTVEAHLSRVYTKLLIHSRAELGARFALPSPASLRSPP